MGVLDRSGARQPTLEARLADPKISWQALTVAWYGGQQRLVEVASGTAIWYHNGLPPVPIRWVLLRDPQSQFAPQALLCTDQAISPTQIIEWFVWRGPHGSHLARGADAPGSRNAATMVRFGNFADDTGVMGTLLPGNTVRSDLA